MGEDDIENRGKMLDLKNIRAARKLPEVSENVATKTIDEFAARLGVSGWYDWLPFKE